MDSDWRKRLRDAIATKQTNKKRLSLAAGLGETFVRDILDRDRVPSAENAKKLASTLGVPYADIFGSGDISPNEARGVIEIGGQEFARMPVHDIRFAAGAGAQNYDEEPIDFQLMSMNFLRAQTDAPVSAIRWFQAHGDSMEHSIYDRDWFAVDCRKTSLYNPGIFALVFEGEGLLKRAAQHLETRAVTLISDNSKYPQQTIKKPERLTVVGRVFLSIRRH